MSEISYVDTNASGAKEASCQFSKEQRDAVGFRSMPCLGQRLTVSMAVRNKPCGGAGQARLSFKGYFLACNRKPLTCRVHEGH